MKWFNSKREKPLILHVDDSEDVLLMTRLMLRKSGFDVIIASDAQSGVEMAEKQSPDLILMDAEMPDIDGYQACQALKQNPKTRDIPIIMATAEDRVKQVDRALALGADNYITKPLNQERLQTKIRETLDIPGSASE